MATLPDSSVWIEFFRRGDAGRADRLVQLLSEREVLVCGPVAAELASGVEAAERGAVWRRLGGLPWAGLDRDGWLRAAEVKHGLDAAGLRVPLTDIEIAVTAGRASAELWSFDSDFTRIAEAMPELTLVNR